MRTEIEGVIMIGEYHILKKTKCTNLNSFVINIIYDNNHPFHSHS